LVLSQIRKRDGKIVLFNKEKITNVIFRAASSVGGRDKELAKKLSNQIVEILESKYDDNNIPNVEHVQDVVEKVLIEEGHAKTSKSYILYREKRRQLRETKHTLLDIEQTMDEYLKRSDWRVNENSNVDFSLGGLILYISGKITANYWLNNIYNKDIRDAHVNGDFHIHDLSMFNAYSFYRNETIVVKDKYTKKVYCLALEQLYDLVEEDIVEENGFQIKHTNSFEILDEEGWTNIQRVLRHKTNKRLLSFNVRKGNNIIITEDHPFIVLNEKKEIIQCPECNSGNIRKNKTNKGSRDHFKCKECNKNFPFEINKNINTNSRNEKIAGEILMNEYALVPDIKFKVQKDVNIISPKDGWFLGFFIAEGYFVYKNRYISFNLNKDSLEISKLFNYLNSNKIEYVALDRSCIETSNGVCLQNPTKQGIVQIKIPIHQLKQELQYSLLQVRSYCENKNLPMEFLSYGDNVIGGIVSGIIDGDGVIRNDDKWVSRAVLRMTSKTALSQIQTWLSLNNINSSLSTIDSFGEREYNNVKIESKKQLYALRFYIPESKKDFFNECLKIDERFLFSKEDLDKKQFSEFRKIEEIKNDSEFVYDITTDTHTFLCNGILAHNCAGWSLRQLITEGFGGVPNKLETVPAKHMDTIIGQMVNFLGTLQNEWAGAQAFSSFDTYLSAFVKHDNLNYKQTKQQIQRFMFNIATPSRWGSQTPFVNTTIDWVVPEDMKNQAAIVGGKEQSYTYGDCQKEMDMVNKAFIECMVEGDASKRIFTFPIPTYNITRDFDWDSENSKLLFEMTAKYGIPYFQNFINSSLKPSDVRSMCCRLQLDLRELKNRTGGLFGAGENTGSVGVVTMNMPRIGYLANTEEEFLDRLEYLMKMAKQSLETKRKVISQKMEQGLLPYTKRYLGNLDHHFSTIGLNGMNEACLNLFGENIATQRSRNFSIKVLEFMRNKLVDFQEETKNIYNLEATPAEGVSYRLAKTDKNKFPDIITAGKEEPYYTNSTSLPVNYTDDLFEALEHQDELLTKYTGGSVLHGFLGERLNDYETTKKLVKRIAYNFRLPYYTITPTFSICQQHGYLSGEQHNCPQCNTPAEVYSRVVGFLRPVSMYNKGKKEEFFERKTFDYNKSMNHQISEETLKKIKAQETLN